MSTTKAIARARIEVMRSTGILDTDETESQSNTLSADVTVEDEHITTGQIHHHQGAAERNASNDSRYQGSMRILDPDFRLNAPLPDEGEDDASLPPTPAADGRPNATISETSDTAEQTRSVPLGSVGDADSPLLLKQPQVIYPSGNGTDSMNDKTAFSFRIWVQRRWKAALFAIISLSVFLLATIIVIIILALRQSSGSGSKSEEQGTNGAANTLKTTPLIDTIKSRGNLACGLVEYPGLSVQDSKTKIWSGFEVDLCRAIGAAIFGGDGHVSFTASTYAERFNLLKSKEVDLLAAGATYTMERDLYEEAAKVGFTFSVPYLYNGVSFAGVPKFVACADQGLTTGNCTGIKICVQDGTSHVQVLKSLFPNLSVINLAPSTPDFYNNFVKGLCNVLAGEQFDLAQSNVIQAGYSGAYNFSQNLYSKEPIALVTRDDDAAWSDFVNWVFLALLTAEKQSITQETAQKTISNPGPAVDTSQLPSYQAVATVGNYAELYNRHLESIVPRALVNQQNNGSTPLIYSFPFGNNASIGPGPLAGGTLERILQRGYLLCGTGETPFFAGYNRTEQEWQGFDVDYCRAVSAAVFNGKGSTVYVPLTNTNRWALLQNGTIDLLSWDTTWNYQRDVLEPSTQTGFTFAWADFYTGLQLGGIPPYGKCAQSVNVQGNCSALKICVKDGTTIIDNLRRLFLNGTIVPRINDQQVADCLRNKIGNAIAADGFFTAAATVRAQGYTGSYETSTTLLSGENLAIVTRQDDPQWSSFVSWIVMATFYAAEENITQASYQSMPTINLFGLDFALMFQNAILAAGSHSEILKRNSEGKYNISAINQLNINPYGPQHFPPGGLFSLY